MHLVALEATKPYQVNMEYSANYQCTINISTIEITMVLHKTVREIKKKRKDVNRHGTIRTRQH